MSEDFPPEMLLRAAFDGSTASAQILAELMVVLVQKDVLSAADVRVVMSRAASVIQHSAPASAARPVWQTAADLLQGRLGSAAQSPALPVLPIPDPEE
ncbi:MAG: hypothetical protein K5Q68_14865 [Roseococcus sp.]|nr:hypothetical protein [Roseococcus sp.]